MKRQRAIGLISILIIAAILSCGFLVAYSRLHGRKTPANPIKSLQPSSATPSPTGAQAKFLFAGTTFWGRRTNTLARASGLGVKYPFSELHTLNRKQYDAWITGLECPITDNGHTYYNEYELLKFNCDPDYLPELKNWVTAMMLGTNHTDNWGPDGFAQTKETTRSATIEANGYWDKSVNFAAWHRLGQYCLKNQSSCLTKIQQAGLQKPPIKWQFDFHGTTSANSAIPRLASPTEQQEISQRLNWEHTMSGLK